ncbi:hypothetical protein BKA56DRAFT_601507 [Ilyonectria sp. MPI-CAGE-AT-0026]|nr:hypothetical protein BKA56DRAFT_601507 [Ilyonectria sp. MPI-CAGE-AT-0026]
MTQDTPTADAKLAALWECVGRWTNDVRQIKSPQDEYQQKYDVIRGRFDHELQLSRKRTIQSEGSCSSLDTLVQLGAEMKDLEIQYKQSVTAMEREYQERLDAAHKSFAYSIIAAFGGTLSDSGIQDKLRLALVPRGSTSETDTADEGPDTAPDPCTDPGANCAPDDPTTDGTTPEETPSSGEAENPISNPEFNPEENAAQPTSPTPDTDATLQIEPGSEATSAVQEDLPSQTNPVSQMNRIAETNPTEANPSLKTNPAPHVNSPAQTNRSLETNVVPEMNSNPTSSSASGTNIAQNGTLQKAKRAHEPNSVTASQVPAKKGLVRILPKQREAAHNNASTGWTPINPRMPSNVPAVDPHPSTKRPPVTIIDQQQQKRPRHGGEPERVIDFDDVFQDGNAPVKYIIAQFPRRTGDWYILECKKHRKHFVHDPVHGAASHLASRKHSMTRGYTTAVETLGTRVLNCNDVLAEKNNEVARCAFKKRLELERSRCTEQTQLHSGDEIESDRPLQDLGTSIPKRVFTPVVGGIYAARYPKVRHIYPVLILPWESLELSKWKAVLLRRTPSCYLFDMEVDPYPRGWAEGYENGGPLASERHYPTIYFDGRQFPEESFVGWVRVSRFTPFDPDDLNIVNRSKVAEFLQSKDCRLTSNQHASRERCIVISDDSEDEDLGTGNVMEQENSENGPGRDKSTSDNGENTTISEQGFGQDTANLSGTQIQKIPSYARNLLHPLPQPTTGVEGQRAEKPGTAGQSGQPILQWIIERPQDRFISTRLPEDEEQTALAPMAVMSTTQEVVGNGWPSFPIDGITNEPVDVYHTGTHKSTAVDLSKPNSS